MPLQDITITASINSLVTQSYGQKTYIASSDLESYPIEHITGSHAETWPDFVSDTNYTINLIVNVTQSWSGSNIAPLGIIPYIHNTNDEFFNGEFSGSNYVVSDGNLTDDNCQQFLEVNTVAANYSVYFYNSVSASFGSYIHRYTSPRNGEMLVYYETTTSGGNSYKKIKYVKIAKIDQEGNDLTITLRELNNLRWTDSGAGEILLNVVNITKYPDYYFYEVTSKTWINTSYTDNNILNYTLNATSSAKFFITSNKYTYLTSSLVSITDASNGLNNGQYTFPLTPNCPITYTASINITASTNTTFSWAINGYDPLYSVYVPNAASSIPGPISLIQGSNTYYLSSGNYTLYITNSINYPIQDFLYEIDAYAVNSNITSNPYLTGSRPFPFDGLPIDWVSLEDDNPYSQESVPGYSTIESIGVSTPGFFSSSGYPGGVAFINPNPQSNTPPTSSIFTITSSLWPLFTPGETYQVEIVIPPPTYNIDTNAYYGPSSYPVTCSYNHYQIPTNPSRHIGYIPSGAYGTFTFVFTAVGGAPPTQSREIAIYTNPSCSDVGGSIPKYFTILEISSRITSSIEANNLLFKITQSLPPQSSSSSIIYEPYLTSIFTNSDCDVLMNNYSQNEISGLRRRVLYDDGSIIPSNIEQIISGTAEYAEVSDYLYSAAANTKPRYSGVKSTSPGINQNTTEGGYGKLPNVESLQTYIAYYDYITSSYAELLDKSLAHIKYLIDKDGNVLTPSISSSYYYNLIDNFETGKKANITLDSTDTIYTIGLKNILRPGAVPRAIAASQTGSGNNFNTTMSFGNTTSTTVVPNYASLINGVTGSSFQRISHNSTSGVIIVSNLDLISTVYNGLETSINIGTDVITTNTTANNVSLNFKVTGRASLALFRNGANYTTMTHEAILQESTNGGGSWSEIDRISFSTTYGQFSTLNLNFKSFTPISSNQYRIQIEHSSYFYDLDLRDIKVSLLQIPIPTNLGEVTSSYWYTGSNSKNILTGSQFLPIYSSYRAYQANYADSGYKDFLEFDVRSSDEIRFEGDESQVYIIYEVLTDNNNFCLRLDRNIVDGTNLDSFLIRRYEPNPNFITFDWDGAEYFSAFSSGDGFILPEFMTNDLQQNFDKIIVSLRERALI